MQIRKAIPEELDSIMSVYAHAREFMRKNGNPGQWIDGYPQAGIVSDDIRNGHCYVCTSNHILWGVFSFMEGPEPNYLTIYDGQWPDNEPYSVIHRLASAPGSHGIGDLCLQWCGRQASNLRADTHRDNSIMQKILIRNEFIPCGTIRVQNGTERIAFCKANR